MGSVCVCFFFFKQKTAYEMRISDWSSDVCSSDLATRRWQDPGLDPAVDPREPSGLQAAISGSRRERYAGDGPAGVHEWLDALQIGRASCRERVCQYV